MTKHPTGQFPPPLRTHRGGADVSRPDAAEPGSEGAAPDALIARLRSAYAPPPRDALQRAAFTRQVMQRLPGTRRWTWQPLAAAAAAACLALWLGFTGAPAPRADAADGATLLALALDDAPAHHDDEFLPDDYALLASDLDR